MLLGSSFLQAPTSVKLRPLHLPTPCLRSVAPPIRLPRPSPSFTVKASKSVRGWVIANSSQKTIKVEVTRLVPHPTYKTLIRIKKKFQVHDPDGRFRIGDWVQLEKCRPISKTKHHTAIEVTDPNAPRPNPRLIRLRYKKAKLSKPSRKK